MPNVLEMFKNSKNKYIDKMSNIWELEHGQADVKYQNFETKYGKWFLVLIRIDKVTQLKQILKKYDIEGVDSVSFLEFIWVTESNVDYQDSRKRTKINIAAKDGHILVLQQLLDFGADPNILDKDRFTALGLAVREGHDDIALALLQDKKVDMNIGAGNLGSPLHIAVVNHKVDIVEKMIKLGANINKTDNEGNTPLHQLMSIYTKNKEISLKLLKTLIINGANPNSLNFQELSPLLLAIKKRQKGAIKDMLNLSKDADIQKWILSCESQHQHSGSVSNNNSLQFKLERLNKNDFSKSTEKPIFDLNGHSKYS